MSDNLIDQADALMRRRIFIAGANSETIAPDESGHAIGANKTDENSSLEDVPILTDVVVAQDIQPHIEATSSMQTEGFSASHSEPSANQNFNQLLLERQALLTHEIETWLDEQLPQMVIRAMDGITDHLVALLANRARDDLLPRLEAAMQAAEEAASDVDNAE